LFVSCVFISESFLTRPQKKKKKKKKKKKNLRLLPPTARSIDKIRADPAATLDPRAVKSAPGDASGTSGDDDRNCDANGDGTTSVDDDRNCDANGDGATSVDDDRNCDANGDGTTSDAAEPDYAAALSGAAGPARRNRARRRILQTPILRPSERVLALFASTVSIKDPRYPRVEALLAAYRTAVGDEIADTAALVETWD
jgi:hypothetical protein